MKKTVKIYYLLLLVVMVFQAVTTVFKLSKTVCYQDRINKLQQQKVSLELQAQQLDKQISQELSLTHNQLSLSSEYQPISEPIVITNTETVALK